MTRYMPVAIPGTSGADHLNHEVKERLPEEGYASRGAAERGWYRACRRANDRRRSLGYRSVSRPMCRVVEVRP